MQLQPGRKPGIGPGKAIKLSKFKVDAGTPIPSLPISESEELSDKFTCIKSISTKPKTVSSSGESSKPPAASQLFCCPEEGCVRSYQRFSVLQEHLDCGKHERILKRKTLLDKAVHGYAVRLEEQFGSVPQMHLSPETQMTASQLSLAMGWTLKNSQSSRTRFSEKQKNYLLSKFFYRGANRAEGQRCLSCPLNGKCKRYKRQPFVHQR